MPIYEYVCNDCGKKFETIEGFHDEIEKGCQFCPGTARRVVSQSSFILKGSGWYLTDYARKPSQPDSGQKEGMQGGAKSKDGKVSSKDSGKSGGSSKDTPRASSKSS